MQRDFLGESHPPTGERPEGVLGGRDGRVDGARSESGAAREQAVIGEVVEGFSQDGRGLHDDLLQRVHRRGARFHGGIPCDLELADHLDGAVRGLGDGRRLPREQGPRRHLGVDGVGLAGGAACTAVAPIHFHDMMPGSADGPCQASAVAPGALDPERLNPPVCLGPRDQSLVATRVHYERVIAQTDPPAVDCHRDVDMRMRINTDDHRPRFGRRSYAVGHGLASSDCGPELVRVGGQDCDGPAATSTHHSPVRPSGRRTSTRGGHPVTNHRTIQPDARKVIVGVDPHKHVHVAVAIDTWGIRLGDRSCAADSDGYQQLITWAERHGRVAAFGIEGTGSYGAGLARAVRRAGHQVLEVNRGDRRTRRIAGKSDTVDAETAARSVLAGQSTAIPKTADGAVEMMRHLKVARRTAVKARTSAMITLKQIVVTAPPELRETLHPLADQALLKRCRGWRCGTIDTPTASAKHTLRALARRWFALSVEIVDHDRHLGRLTTQTSPTLREGLGIGADTAAERLIIFGDNPDRIHSEAAFAKLCGACPIPASSGMTTGRHRLYRGGHRQANAALHRAVIVRMRYHSPTLNDVERRTAEGRPKREIIRCLKRVLAREIFQRVMADYRARQAADLAA